MHCAGCVGVVENALRKVAGVESASVNLATERATVQVRDMQETSRTALAEAIRSAGYEVGDDGVTAAAAGDADADQTITRERNAELRAEAMRVLLAALLGAPVVAMHVAHALTAGRAAHEAAHTSAAAIAWEWGQLGLATAAVAVGARKMILGAGRALAARNANMDLLVSIGALTALLSSLAGVALQRPALVQLDAAVMIAVLVAFGKHLEARARGRAGAALAMLSERIPRQALRILEEPAGDVDANRANGMDAAPAAALIPVADVTLGMRLRLAPPAAVPVDGTILSGRVTIDQSSLTGESIPVERGPGDGVRSGTRVVAGLADMRADATGADSAAARIARLVENAQAAKTPWQRLADRVAGVFVPIVLALAAATLVGWWLAGADFAIALEHAIAVLVVACPCAMGLAIPTAVLVGTTAAAQRGILVRDAAALEAAAAVDVVLLDKTGTLTRGKPTLAVIEPLEGVGQLDLLRTAASAAQFSEHPLSRAIADAAREAGQKLATPTHYDVQSGLGIQADVGGRRVLVGSAAWLANAGVDTVGAEPRADALASQGMATAWCGRDGRLIGIFGLRDEAHPAAAEAIRALQKMGVLTWILSGDRQPAVAAMAASLGVTGFEAQLSPEQKLERVQAAGRRGRVAMVGDGINDAPALAIADVGIAIGTGADVAREAADICLIGSSPLGVAEAISLARASVRVMRQNLVWAFGYNAIMLPLAIFGALPAAAAAGAMMLSSLSVVANSLRLGRFSSRR